MSNSTQNRPLRSILPPHILMAIALKSQDVVQRNRAIHVLSLDHTHRSARLIRSQHRLHFPHEHTLVTAKTQIQRTIYDAHGTMDLPGSIVRAEGGPAVGDPAVNEAYDGLGWTHAFYLQVYKRNSIDNEGLPLQGVVHYGTDYDNAFWDGTRMIFGDGDNEFFNRFTIAIDVIGHELTHGVTEYEANLVYSGQSGALNESISDVFGSMIKQYSLNKQRVDQADWLIGADLFTAKVHGTNGRSAALRDMANPGQAYNDPLLGKDPQPSHMDQYDPTIEDNGGVHINSGIPNRAFYLTASALGGYSWECAGRIWYETVCDPRLRPTAQFSDFAKLTLENAEKLYRFDSPEWRAVRDAWDRVGVPVPVPAMGAR